MYNMWLGSSKKKVKKWLEALVLQNTMMLKEEYLSFKE